MSNKILLTGCCGFIGTNISLRLIQDNIPFVGVDNNPQHHKRYPEQIKNQAEIIEADFSDDSILKRIKNKEFDAILHQAAIPRVSYSVQYPTETTRENILKTVSLLEAAAGNCRRFVFASSSSVYGNVQTLPQVETMPCEPKSPYALQKRTIEEYIRIFCDLKGLDAICLRYFNVIGPHQYGDSPYSTALSSWCYRVKNNIPLRSDGTGDQSRDLCYVDNVVHANLLAAKSQKRFKGEKINISCGDRTSNNEILNAFRDKFPNIVIEQSPPRPGDVMHTQAGISYAKELIGYEPQVRFWEGFERTLKWWGLI